jgi:hypothetical protein
VARPKKHGQWTFNKQNFGQVKGVAGVKKDILLYNKGSLTRPGSPQQTNLLLAMQRESGVGYRSRFTKHRHTTRTHKRHYARTLSITLVAQAWVQLRRHGVKVQCSR